MVLLTTAFLCPSAQNSQVPAVPSLRRQFKIVAFVESWLQLSAHAWDDVPHSNLMQLQKTQMSCLAGGKASFMAPSDYKLLKGLLYTF